MYATADKLNIWTRLIHININQIDFYFGFAASDFDFLHVTVIRMAWVSDW